MKRNRVHIAFSFLLLVNLFFTQVAVGFLHTHNHEAGAENSFSFQSEESISEKHFSCEICSLDLFHELYISELFSWNSIFSVESSYTIHHVDAVFATTISASGRAPPFVI